DRDFIRPGDQSYAFVKPLVSSTEQDQSLVTGQLLDDALRESAPLRREHHQVTRIRLGRSHRLDTLDHRLDLEDHAGTATKGAVIHLFMFSFGPVAGLCNCTSTRPD